MPHVVQVEPSDEGKMKIVNLIPGEAKIGTRTYTVVKSTKVNIVGKKCFLNVLGWEVVGCSSSDGNYNGGTVVPQSMTASKCTKVTVENLIPFLIGDTGFCTGVLTNSKGNSIPCQCSYTLVSAGQTKVSFI